jgi:methylamine dehydrogenase light chain
LDGFVRFTGDPTLTKPDSEEGVGQVTSVQDGYLIVTPQDYSGTLILTLTYEYFDEQGEELTSTMVYSFDVEPVNDIPTGMPPQLLDGGHGGGRSKGPDDQQCDYWRYCAVDGFLCSCCGGTVNSCPPGTEPSKVSWIGTCRNPADGKDYLISYFDCCGKAACGRCLCNTNLGERPAYRITLHNDINWCMGSTSTMFHCTASLVVGIADKK